MHFFLYRSGRRDVQGSVQDDAGMEGLGEHIGTHKSVPRSRLDLPRRRERLNVKKGEVAEHREKESDAEETDWPVRRKWSTVKVEMVKVKDAEDIHEEIESEKQRGETMGEEEPCSD